MTEQYINKESIDMSRLVLALESWMARNGKAYRPLRNNDWFESISIHADMIEIQALEYDDNLKKEFQITRIIPISPRGYRFFSEFKTDWIVIDLKLIEKIGIVRTRQEQQCR